MKAVFSFGNAIDEFAGKVIDSLEKHPTERPKAEAFTAFTKAVHVTFKGSNASLALQRIEAESGLTSRAESLIGECDSFRTVASAFENLTDAECSFVTLAFWVRTIWLTRSYPPQVAVEYLSALVGEDAALLMKNISSNENQDMHVRSMAMLVRAEIESDPRERNIPTRFSLEASYRRKSQLFASKIPPDAFPSPLRKMFLLVHNQSAARLLRLEGPPRPTIKLHDVASKLDYLWTVGGAFCDCCRKSREEVGMVVFFKCKRCRLAHYCSPECQSKAWDAGHKHACREFGRFKKGDALFVQGMKHPHSELNLVPLTVTGKAADDKLVLQCFLNSKVFAADLHYTKNLRHARPLM